MACLASLRLVHSGPKNHATNIRTRTPAEFAKVLKRRKVSGGRIRFLNQFDPAETDVDYLKSLKTEEERLRAVIKHDCPDHKATRASK